MFFYKFFFKDSHAARRFAFGGFCVIAAASKAARWMMPRAKKLFFKMAAALCRAGFCRFRIFAAWILQILNADSVCSMSTAQHGVRRGKTVTVFY